MNIVYMRPRHQKKEARIRSGYKKRKKENGRIALKAQFSIQRKLATPYSQYILELP